MKILFVCPYPAGLAPSQRFRFEQYFSLLNAKGIDYVQASFLTEQDYRILYKSGSMSRKFIAVVKGFLRRFFLVFKVGGYNKIFIHREASPLGPPVFEFLVSRVLGKDVIYDFDDAIWLPNTSKENKLIAGIKWHSKVRSIIKWSKAVSCGNEYLCQFARQYNSKVILNPTTVDTICLHKTIKDQNSERLVIGWTGTHSTAVYLLDIIPAVAELEKKYDFDFLVISNQNPALPLKSFIFCPWNKETEIEDLLQINIGIMPLKEDEWSEGKCGFKLLQYMALGIPSVASPVGVNTRIIESNENGYLSSGTQDWIKYLSMLLEDAGLRQRLGSAGRQKVVKDFSTVANSENFLSLLNS